MGCIRVRHMIIEHNVVGISKKISKNKAECTKMQMDI